eukprot:gene31519-40930_t
MDCENKTNPNYLDRIDPSKKSSSVHHTLIDRDKVTAEKQRAISTHTFTTAELLTGLSNVVSISIPWCKGVLRSPSSREMQSLSVCLFPVATQYLLRDRAHQSATSEFWAKLDHGKSTVTAALCQLKSLKAASLETVQGAKISLARADFETASRHYALVDCVGPNDHIKSMIVGAAPMTGAILVVSAVEGPMPETADQISSDIGVGSIVVYLNKCDLVKDEDLLELVEIEVRELLLRFNFPGDSLPVIRGSAKSAMEGSEEASILGLVNALDASIPLEVPPTSTNSRLSFMFRGYMLTQDEGGRHTPFFRGYRPFFSIGAQKLEGEIALPETVESVFPGNNFTAEARFVVPVEITKGLRFTICGSDSKVIIIGVVISSD